MFWINNCFVVVWMNLCRVQSKEEMGLYSLWVADLWMNACSTDAYQLHKSVS